jgi:iron complex outermembrane receptor protein
MSIGYNFDLAESSGFNKIRVYLSGNNLFFITKYKGVDPNPRFQDYGNKLVPGIDRRNTWFRTSSISLGVNLSF